MDKPRLSNWKIWNMSVGLLGINFGWGLQMANMSAIYEYLGAKPDQIPILWLAAPLTGLLVQPIIGYLSDHTWCRFGRRKPYFMIGALLSTLALIFMPLSQSIWMAAIFLWILDASVNISMGPFRALVPDILPKKQRTKGFIYQGLAIAAGAVTASALPWILQNIFHVQVTTTATHHIPSVVKYSFWIGAVIFVITIMWTFLTTNEFPPEELYEKPIPKNNSKISWKNTFYEIKNDFTHMPIKMIKLAWVMVFSWMGLFCMYLFFPIAVASQIFHAQPDSAAYLAGQEWAGLCFAVYAFFFLIVSFILPSLARKFARRDIYAVSLIFGGLSLIGILFIHTHYCLFLLMLGVGIAYAAMQSMPYAMLADVVPTEKMGIFMGIFNLFIVIPEILVSVGLGFLMKDFLHDNRIAGVVIGGVLMLIAAVLAFRIKPVNPKKVMED